MVKIAMVDKKLGHSLKGMRCAVSGSGNLALYAAEKLLEYDAKVAVSGSGNLALYAAEKLLEYDAKVITVSVSNGALVFDNGMTTEDLAKIHGSLCEDW